LLDNPIKIVYDNFKFNESPQIQGKGIVEEILCAQRAAVSV
jgi:hypothetical protein